MYSRKVKRAVLIGNYGQANFGDEALREYFTSTFPEIEWTVLVAGKAKGPREVPRLPLGCRSLIRPWWRTVRAYWKADAVVFGGGTLFTDIESVRACILWGWHACVARLLGRKIVLAAQGIGPFQTKLGERIARKVVTWAAAISVRDEQSLSRIASWPKNTEVVRVFDPVFSLYKDQRPELRSQNILIVIPRLNSGDAFFSAVRAEVQTGRYVGIRILLLEPDHPLEKRQCVKLQEENAGLPVDICELRSAGDVVPAFTDTGLVLTQRYHGAILALALQVPFRVVPQAPGDKLEAISRELQDREAFLLGVEALKKQMTAILSP